MDDFIFGTLSTDALRLAHVRRLRAGITHNHARTPRDPLPGEAITLELTAGPENPVERAWVYWTNDDTDPSGENGAPRNGRVTPMEPAGAEWDTLLWGYVQRFRAILPPQPAGTLVRYRISATADRRPPTDDDWRSAVSGRRSPVEFFADEGAFYAFYVADDPAPAWAQDAIVYQIFVDRFHPGSAGQWKRPRKPSGFYGGTLNGIRENLDYVAALGANTLWLTPIFRSPSHHGYDATDYFDIEPRLGTKDDLRRLLDDAHGRGIRVLLDFVANHWSSQHNTFQQAIQDPASPFRQWYTFDHWPTEYKTFFGVKDLPEINLRCAPARQHVLDAAAHWLEFGADGYRLDYCIGPTPDFWADFRRVTRQVKPDCWTFGEAVDLPATQITFEGALDGCLDFMLLEALRQTFAFGRWDAARFATFLDRHEAFFPASFSRPSFLDNHDMNRILWVLQNDTQRLKLAALCQFTLGGPPIIYYGTEVGLSQLRDVRQGVFGIPEESRLPMLWGSRQNAALLDFYRRLIALRHAQPALRRGARQTFFADADALLYTRTMGNDQLTVALNLASQPRALTLPGAATLLLSTHPLASAGSTVELPPYTGAVFNVKR